jgi:hypothetical protein
LGDALLGAHRPDGGGGRGIAAHGYYSTAHWLGLRAEALARDGYHCTIAGCIRPATIVDHIETRPRCSWPTPADRLDNLRSLCATHDGEMKERRGRAGSIRGQARRRAVGADGWPL